MPDQEGAPAPDAVAGIIDLIERYASDSYEFGRTAKSTGGRLAEQSKRIRAALTADRNSLKAENADHAEAVVNLEAAFAAIVAERNELRRENAGMMASIRAAEFAVSMWAGGPVDPSELDEAMGFLNMRLLEMPPGILHAATPPPDGHD